MNLPALTPIAGDPKTRRSPAPGRPLEFSPVPGHAEPRAPEASNRQSELIEIVISARKQRPGAISNRQLFGGVAARRFAALFAAILATFALGSPVSAPAQANPPAKIPGDMA